MTRTTRSILAALVFAFAAGSATAQESDTAPVCAKKVTSETAKNGDTYIRVQWICVPAK